MAPPLLGPLFLASPIPASPSLAPPLAPSLLAPFSQAPPLTTPLLAPPLAPPSWWGFGQLIAGLLLEEQMGQSTNKQVSAI